MLDFGRIKELCRKRGVTFLALAHDADVDPSHLRRQLKVRPWTVATGTTDRMANFLKVPAQIINPGVILSGDGWKRFELVEMKMLEQFHLEMKESRHCLTITRGIESYLQSPEMTHWTSAEWLGNPGWDDRIDLTKRYRVQIVGARDKSNFIHRIVAPALLFSEAAVVQVAWLEEILSALDNYDRETVIGLISNWRSFEAKIARILPSWVGRWEKITIVDGVLALVRGSIEQYAVTYEPSVVDALLEKCEQIAVHHAIGDFPRQEEIKRKRRLTEAHDVVRSSFHAIMRQSQHRRQ